MPPTIRLASQHDAEGVQAIYAPVVRDTAISFEVDPPTVRWPRAWRRSGGGAAGLRLP